MSKKTQTPALSENTRKAIIIAAIIALAVVILVVSLFLIIKPASKTPDDNNSGSTGSSTLPVRNGDFKYVDSESTTYPRTAQNWTRYGYKAVEGSSHDFTTLSTNENALMGIVDTNADNWQTVSEDIAIELPGHDIKNPGLHPNASDEEESNVYMIASKQATTASILSDSVSVSSASSVKISVWLNTAQLAEGSKAVIMIQKSTVSAKSENWYAYNFEIGKSDANKDGGWVEYVFYIFNREASTKYVRVSVGLGNVYSGEEGLPLVGEGSDQPINGEGVLFVDDITLETVNADVYRNYADNATEGDTSYKIIENEDITADSSYLALASDKSDAVETFADSEAYLKDTSVSPFTDRDDFHTDSGDPSGFTIYKLSQKGEGDEPLALRLSENIAVHSSETLKDHHHISFWVRVAQVNKVAKANIYIQKQNDDGTYEDVDSFANVVTSQQIEDDNNCGWVKYDIYLKPSSVQTQISILFVLGDKDNYKENAENGLIPNGDLYVTSPAYESISYKDYNNASSGSTVKKLNLLGDSASTSVSNGSFSDVNNTGNKPSNWTPVFAGSNAIYKDGKPDDAIDGLNTLATAIEGSGTLQGAEFAPTDDAQNNILRIVNNVATSFGYISGDISLSAKTAYVFSVLAKTGDLDPHFYLIDNSKDRSEAVVGKVDAKYPADAKIDCELLGQVPENEATVNNGWVRYYIVYVTGAESTTVRLALFNGTIDGSVKPVGTVYYDNVDMKTLGTYSLVENEDAEEGSEEAKYYKVEWTESENYDKTFDKLLEDGDLDALTVVQPSAEEWKEITLIPEEVEEPEEPSVDEETTPNDIDWTLLLSVISSVALVAALLVVIVIKVFKKRSRNTK